MRAAVLMAVASMWRSGRLHTSTANVASNVGEQVRKESSSPGSSGREGACSGSFGWSVVDTRHQILADPKLQCRNRQTTSQFNLSSLITNRDIPPRP